MPLIASCKTGIKGDILLNISINDAKFYSIEVL
jgi:hypothetical protein